MGMFSTLREQDQLDQKKPMTSVKPAKSQPAVVPAVATQQETQSPTTSKEVSKLVSKEVSKFTSKLVDEIPDPPINKVGYYLTRKEQRKLDRAALSIKEAMLEEHDIKVTKNDVVRACLALGIEEWETNLLTSKLVNLLRSK